MSVIELEQAVQRLSAEELAKFRSWFAEFDASQWDQRIESDVAAGSLDRFADEAIADLHEGHCKDL